MIIGYARVSTDGQTLDALQSALQAAGAERVFAEKQSERRHEAFDLGVAKANCASTTGRVSEKGEWRGLGGRTSQEVTL
jgi:hypothetical protein